MYREPGFANDINRQKLYLDDLEIGVAFRSAEHQRDAEQIKAFASQFNPQPFHLDERVAQDSFFRGLAVRGRPPWR